MLIPIDDQVWRVVDGDRVLGWVEQRLDLGDVRFRARRVIPRGIVRVGDFDTPELAAAAIADLTVQPLPRIRRDRSTGSPRKAWLRRQYPVEH